MVSENTKTAIKIGAGFLIASGIGLVVAGASKMPQWDNPYVLFFSGAIIMIAGTAINEVFRN